MYAFHNEIQYTELDSRDSARCSRKYIHLAKDDGFFRSFSEELLKHGVEKICCSMEEIKYSLKITEYLWSEEQFYPHIRFSK